MFNLLKTNIILCTQWSLEFAMDKWYIEVVVQGWKHNPFDE